ncbi:phosphoribosyltransferase [Desulfatitalea tepidiphila]|uniref:phosphoribosyltransferase n=1 Tax=Desulfatitalea tepidiphila TaxID=1185843 RepID=UPI000975D3C6|nr:phosphoribosyltransferase family protein [Desulfatitalea tepidiphila]
MNILHRGKIFEIQNLRDKVRVFTGREHAGRVLAGMLDAYRETDTMVLAIPSGGVPVGAVLAERLHLPLEVAVVSKITLPWNSEAGYGAVAFDGTVRINEELLPVLQLSEMQKSEGLEKTRQKVARRVLKFRESIPMPHLGGRNAILVDDGLASGFTLLVAVAAVRRMYPEKLVVAVPTGSAERLPKVAREVDELFCANVRGGWSFAVAEAYEHWFDLDEEDAVQMVRAYQKRFEQSRIGP